MLNEKQELESTRTNATNAYNFRKKGVFLYKVRGIDGIGGLISLEPVVVAGMLGAHTADLPPVDLDLALTFGAKSGSHDLPNGACLVFGVIGATVQANLQPVVRSLVLADEFVGIGYSIFGMVGSGGAAMQTVVTS